MDLTRRGGHVASDWADVALEQNFQAESDTERIVPRRAYDGLIYIDAVTPPDDLR